MKKNVMMRLASVLLVAILLSTCALSATFAKYTSTGSGSAEASIANWSFDFDAKDDAVSTALSFNLLESFTNTTALPAGTASVAEGKIAPGTSGSFTIKLKNLSEVAAAYTVDFTVSENCPLLFQVNGGTWGTLADVAATNIAMGATADVVVNWKWEFTDTVENTFAGTTVTVDATVTASQVD